MATLFDLIANMENEKADPKPKPSLDKGKTAVEKKLLSGFWNEELPLDKKKVGDMIITAAKQAGVSPEVFYASAYQEGLRNAKYIGTPQDEGVEYFDAENPDPYPVNGFFHYGLDTFGDKADSMRKKGYLPADFDYQPFRAVNEKHETVNSALFKTNQDALYAKAAYLREFQDQVLDEAKKRGVKLDGDALNYFTMSAYNGGIGNAMKMLDEAKGKDVNEFVNKGLTTRQGVHKNIEPRMRYAKIMRDYLAEQAAKAAIVPSQTPAPMQPITDGTVGLINRF